MSKLQAVTLEPHVVHVWRASTAISDAEERAFSALLSVDEIERANRFYFPIHRRRYIAARGMLRNLLAYYLDVSAQSIPFLYTPYKKPYLGGTTLQFNVSHSHEMAVFAFTQQLPLGIDIEKIESDFKEAVAKRYFSEDEFAELIALPEAEHVSAFYRIWSRKEAFVKAIGLGLHLPLRDFSVSAQNPVEQLYFDYDGFYLWHVESFTAHPGYQSAFAIPRPVKQILYLEWVSGAPAIWTSSGT